MFGSDWLNEEPCDVTWFPHWPTAGESDFLFPASETSFPLRFHKVSCSSSTPPSHPCSRNLSVSECLHRTIQLPRKVLIQTGKKSFWQSRWLNSKLLSWKFSLSSGHEHCKGGGWAPPTGQTDKMLVSVTVMRTYCHLRAVWFHIQNIVSFCTFTCFHLWATSLFTFTYLKTCYSNLSHMINFIHFQT